MSLTKKKNIIVFGSSGLIGSSLKKHLKYDFNIINLDKIKQNVSDINFDASKFIQSQKKFQDGKIFIQPREKVFLT